MDLSAEKSNASDKKRHQSADPFAADIFAEAHKSETFAAGETPPVGIVEKAGWVWHLPKAARSPENLTNLLQHLPAAFSENFPQILAESLSNLLDPENKNSIAFAFVENREVAPETREKEIIENGGETINYWNALIGIEPEATEFIIQIEDAFAAWLVDRMSGEAASEKLRRRMLTRSEIAVLEYLFVHLIHEANAIIKKPLLKFVSLNKRKVRLITSRVSEGLSAIIVSSWQIVAPRSLVKIFITSEALQSLRESENVFSSAAEKQSRMLRALESRVSEVRARLFLGETQTTLADVAGIETGDVILIERYDLIANQNEFHGKAELFLGEGESLRVIGSAEYGDSEPPDGAVNSTENAGNLVRRVNLNHNIRFSISHFESPINANFADTEKSMNEDLAGLSEKSSEDLREETNGDGISLEDLAVTLRVELEARRLTLAEVGNLRVNQIIELGARPTDPVNLIIGAKTVARGELVEVGERLGVRIIQILR